MSYERKVKELKRRLQQDSIETKIIPEAKKIFDYTCYFCLSQINSDVIELKEQFKIDGIIATSRYYIHSYCHEIANIFGNSPLSEN